MPTKHEATARANFGDREAGGLISRSASVNIAEIRQMSRPKACLDVDNGQVFGPGKCRCEWHRRVYSRRVVRAATRHNYRWKNPVSRDW